MTRRPVVLFVCYGGGHAAMVIPVIQALNAVAPQVETPALALTMAGRQFTDARLDHLGFGHFIEPEKDGPALAWGQRLMAGNHSRHTGIPEAESIAYLGINRAELDATHGPAAADALYRDKGRQAFLPERFMARVLDRLQPDLVVTTTSPRAELAARRAARARGLPTVLVSDILSKPSLMAEMHADHICVPGESARAAMAAAGPVQAGTFHLTGNPAMDARAAEAGQAVRQDWRQAEFPVATAPAGYVLLAEQIGHFDASDGRLKPFGTEQILTNLDRLQAAVDAVGAVSLLRPHPSLPPELYAGWVARQQGRAFMADKHDLGDLLNAADVLVSNASTIMMDALYADVPVLLARHPNDATPMPFDEMGFATGAPIDAPAELAAGLQTALTDCTAQARQRAAFGADFAALPAAPRIASVILDALEAG